MAASSHSVADYFDRYSHRFGNHPQLQSRCFTEIDDPALSKELRRTLYFIAGRHAAKRGFLADAIHAMPDVGLTTATEPLDPKYRVVIKYSVEVEGLPVYNESYDVEKIAKELEQDEEKVAELWLRRIKCVAACRHRPAFSASLTRCLADGKLVE